MAVVTHLVDGHEDEILGEEVDVLRPLDHAVERSLLDRQPQPLEEEGVEDMHALTGGRGEATDAGIGELVAVLHQILDVEVHERIVEQKLLGRDRRAMTPEAPHIAVSQHDAALGPLGGVVEEDLAVRLQFLGGEAAADAFGPFGCSRVLLVAAPA